ncbi:hypothetical protein EST38_g14631 [Candolleomyces aberdarensis]|uniref:Uncharacterized protein n=1 Tax=Candolleomyces aberdarensis TaxID=2316362 RepID=A0A4Q2CZ67_9AGAR|nr:hypothetical protein EST38_g14631 [Candolleomyces aberdarensis]
MFHLPSGDEQTAEGQDRGHPITLEGYRAADLNALVKVLYPTPEDLICGAFNLPKEGWVGVLGLATRWQMKKIRQHAIDKLSLMSLDALEKVVLARDHKVAKWLREGLNEIASENPMRSADDLESRLGLRTAFRVLWIRDQGLGQVEEYITLRSVGCPHCSGTFLKEDHACCCCGQKMGLDDRNAIWCKGGLSTSSDQGRPSKAVTSLDGSYLKCTSCNYYSISGNLDCASCSTNNLEWQINEAFASEITEYEACDQ